MKTLYDILGLERSVNSEQIEQAYQNSINKIKAAGRSSDQEAIQLQAMKEAYFVLSSPMRRATYDNKLNAPPRVIHEAAETASVPWLKILLVAALLTGGGIYYQAEQNNKARIVQLALEAEKAKAEAERAAKLAEIEAARLEREEKRELRDAEARQLRQMEQAKREGDRIHAQMLQLDKVKAREQAAEERRQIEKERRERNAQLQEERAARSRVEQQNAAMRRALNMPVGGQGGGRTATIQPRSSSTGR